MRRDPASHTVGWCPSRSRRHGSGRLALLPLFVLGAALAAGPCGTASATPGFDVDGYSTCTATTVPAADQDFDAVVTDCCVQHAGVPAPTRYGVGCVDPADANSADGRPTIVLPTDPVSPDKADDDLNGLIDRPLPDPLP